ncbi:MAG: radical SAM protein [Dissulfurispiraceae bacterium]
MKLHDKKTVIIDLWETLIFGTEDSAISIFYKKITGEDISPEQIRNCLLIGESEPRAFLQKFLELVTPSNLPSMLLAVKNPKSPMHAKILKQFNEHVADTFRGIRWAPGAIELLELLRSKNYRIIIVSNVWAYQKDFFVNELRLGEYVDLWLFSCDMGINKDRILQKLPEVAGVKPGDAIYVGKSYEYDIIPAVNANLSALRVADENNIIDPEKLSLLIKEELDGKAANAAAKFPLSSDAKDVLIVVPPFYKLLGSHNNRLNLSAASLSSYLSHLGYDSTIYHADSRNHENYITRYQMVFNSIEFYEALEKEEAYDEFEDYYAANKADTVFVTCGDLLNPSFDSGNWDSTNKIAKIVRRINPKAYVIAIGPEIGRQSKDFDLVVEGEIENTLQSIMEKRIRGRVSGTLLAEGKFKDVPLFDMKKIVTPVSPVSLDTIIWRRGCAGTCSFCRVAQINRGLIRYRTMDSVFEDIAVRYNGLGIRNFYIVDANFTSHKELVMDFCKRLSSEFPGIRWRTESRFDTLDEELLGVMKDSGCTHLKLGLENALSERHQVKTKKVNLQLASQWIKTIQGTGIKCVIYLMLGGKWFTHSQYEQMYENARSLNADGYTVSLYNPYPDTPAGITHEEWSRRKFIGSHLDIRLIDFWKIPIDVFDAFFSIEMANGREDKDVRKFI